ncbi:TolC family protein [bacterium]|nr:TolC family protein [bacterium]MBU1024958.1 TolC family protein [bacterium]
MHINIINNKLAKYSILVLLIGLCSQINPVSANETSEPLEITINEAILMAFENNTSFKIELLKPELRESQTKLRESDFDLSLSGSVSTSESEGESGSTSRRTSADLDITKKLETGGDISLGLSTDKSGGGTSGGGYSTRIGLSLNHPLFKGAGSSVNLAGINKAKLSEKSSIFELQAVAESLVAQVESACWDYALSKRQLQIYEDSLNLAKRQFEETQVLVDVGKIAEVELVGSKAEVALREESLINAKSTLDKNRFRLLRLINPPDTDIFTTEISITDEFISQAFDMEDIQTHLETALKARPDLNEARIQLEQNALDVKVTKNGLLPRMDLFISLGQTGYADSFGNLLSDIGSDGYDFQIGLNYSQTIGNRDSRERHRQNLIGREQSEIALDNLTLLAKEDVAVQWVEINRTQAQITATVASRTLQEEKLRAETEKYRVGKSTTLLVAQAQRDLLSSQISEAQAISNYRKAIIELFRLEGTLLEHYNIELLKEI